MNQTFFLVISFPQTRIDTTDISNMFTGFIRASRSLSIKCRYNPPEVIVQKAKFCRPNSTLEPVHWFRNGSWSNCKIKNISAYVIASAVAASSLALGLNIVENDAGVAVGSVLASEVMKHNKFDDCWIAINGEVFDVTNFLAIHPGGKERIMKYAGKDATIEFSQMHSKEVLKKMILHIRPVGKLDGEFQEEVTAEMLKIRENLKNKPGIHSIFNLSDFEYVAKHILPQTTYCYFSTGSSEEFTLRENHHAYSRVFFRPMILQDIGPPDLSTSLLGHDVDLPIYITAFAGAKFAHPLGERNLQRAAYGNNVFQMIPKLLSFPLEEFFEEVPDDQKHWFQLHFDTQDELDNVENTIKRMEQYKTVKGLFINVDLADLGNREKDSKKRAEDGTAAAELAAAANNGKVNYPKRFSWAEVERIRSCTSLPIALKGLQRGEDVVLAAQKGIKGCIISNHGGRQLDFSRPPLEVLAEARQMLKEKGLEDNIELYIDGGIRRGSDIIKALCLGAKGVGLGRPFLYAMSGYGEEGVNKVFDILRAEMKNNMRLLGVDKISDLNESLIDITNLKLRTPVVTHDLFDKAYEGLSFPAFKSTE